MLAYLLVEKATGSPLLAGLAFSIAFIALLLAGSELFTEGFLVPVAAVVAGRPSVRSLLRCGAGAGDEPRRRLDRHLAGDPGLPRPRETAIKAGTHYIEYGHGVRALSLAILAGAAITLMTWMQHATEEASAKIVAAVAMGFLLAGAQLFHSILDSLMMFAALHTGEAPFGYLDWLGRLRHRGARQHGRRARPGHHAAAAAGAPTGPGAAAEPGLARRPARSAAPAASARRRA